MSSIIAPQAAPSSRLKRFAVKPDTLIQSVVILLGLTVIQRAVGFTRSLLLCRWLPPEELGHWDLTLGFLELAAPIAVLSIPGLFSRYVTHYGHRRQLRMYLRRSAAAIVGLTGLAVAALWLARARLSYLLVGSKEDAATIVVVMVTLPSLILFNSLILLFGGFRMNRVVAVLQFMQGVLFAALALSLTAAWRAQAASVAMAYGAACATCCLLGFYWLSHTWKALPSDASTVPLGRFWAKLLPFAMSVWLVNLLANLFELTSRSMLLHYSGMQPAEALAAVGQYHSARIIPLLIVSLASMMGAMVIPFLSSDWEAGRHRIVSLRINLSLKIIGLGLTAGSALVLLAAPVLFTGVLAGKFAAGQAILPWTLMCAVWFSMIYFAETYLWCDERIGLVCFAFFAGLVVNVGTNLLLLPVWGLQGAVLSASAGNLALLLMIFGFANWRGLRLDVGTWAVSASPLALTLGPWAALTVLAALTATAWSSHRIFSPDEKDQLHAMIRRYVDRFQTWRGRGQETTDPIEL